MKLMIAAALAGGAVLAPVATAQEASKQTGFNWSIGYGAVTVEDDAGIGAHIGAVQAKLGYRFNPNFGIEGEAAFGVNDDTFSVPNLLGPLTIGLDREWGVFGLTYFPLGNGFDLFARAGFANAHLDGSYLGFPVEVKDDGLGVGGGAIWDAGLIDVRLEYTHYDIDGDTSAYALSLGGKF